MALNVGTPPPRSRPTIGCVVDRVVLERGPDDAAALLALMRDHAWAPRALSAALANPRDGAPLAVSDQVIRRHRNGDCGSCITAGRTP